MDTVPPLGEPGWFVHAQPELAANGANLSGAWLFGMGQEQPDVAVKCIGLGLVACLGSPCRPIRRQVSEVRCELMGLKYPDYFRVLRWEPAIPWTRVSGRGKRTWAGRDLQAQFLKWCSKTAKVRFWTEPGKQGELPMLLAGAGWLGYRVAVLQGAGHWPELGRTRGIGPRRQLPPDFWPAAFGPSRLGREE